LRTLIIERRLRTPMVRRHLWTKILCC